jgi:hypothetical protein
LDGTYDGLRTVQTEEGGIEVQRRKDAANQKKEWNRRNKKVRSANAIPLREPFKRAAVRQFAHGSLRRAIP